MNFSRILGIVIEFIAWLMFGAGVFIVLAATFEDAHACKRRTLFAEYSHHSSVPDGKPFGGHDRTVTNVYSLVYVIPTKWVEFELGLGIDNHHIYGREPTGTFRARVPLWGVSHD